jgi:hypothetical protein
LPPHPPADPTWQVQQSRLQQRGGQVLHLGAEGKDAGAQAADQEVEEVEDLLRGPAVLGHAALDADDLDLRPWKHVAARLLGMELLLLQGATARATRCRRPPLAATHQRYDSQRAIRHGQSIKNTLLPSGAGVYFPPPATRQWAGRSRLAPCTQTAALNAI